MRTALVAGALLAFALSFDEIIVTRFTIGADLETLPIWIYNNLFRSNQLPIVNVVAVIVIVISIIPVYFANKLTPGRRRRRRPRRRRQARAGERRGDRGPVAPSSLSPARGDLECEICGSIQGYLDRAAALEAAGLSE